MYLYTASERAHMCTVGALPGPAATFVENQHIVQESLEHQQRRQATGPVGGERLASLLEAELDIALTELDGTSPLMATMARYHLGMIDASGVPTEPATRQIVQGKRFRPLLAMMTAEAVGGSAEIAAPVAAAIELLHNFTLIHDDIQDRSPNRRHRPTVWRIWGDAQAINAGDALFAAAQLALLRTSPQAIPAASVLALTGEFSRATISIVRGQVHDLENEGRPGVTPEDYLTMIGGKTAAIVRYAAWAGAIAGGASSDVAAQLGDVGETLGLGFQIRDDMLGIWGSRKETGKDAADDIRRRKQSLPILMLRAQANEDDAARLDALFGGGEINPAGIDEVLALLDRYQIARQVTDQVEQAHQRTQETLARALPERHPDDTAGLLQLIAALRSRTS
jgi:geranylgeranyl diphosphate synthase, type I